MTELSRRSLLATATAAGLAPAAHAQNAAHTPAQNANQNAKQNATQNAAPPAATAQGPRPAIAVRLDRQPEVLDPAFRTGLQDGNIVRAIGQRLVSLTPDGNTVPDAARELKQDDPTTLSFTLNEGQMFTENYGELTAEDVKFSFERFAVAPVNGKESPYKGDWANLGVVEITGKYTGRIHMEKPRAGLIPIAVADVSGTIVCRRAIEERGADYARSPVGSGAMMVSAFDPQRGVTLVRNPAFKGTAAGFEKIDARFVADPKTAELALRSGELDFALLPPSNIEPLRTLNALKVLERPGIANVWLGLNVEKPPFNDIRVRQAIRAALDVNQMLLAGYNGKAPRADALVMPGVVGHWKDAPAPARNVAEARRLLAEAGMPNGFKARITVQSVPTFQAMALVARAQLGEVGIQLEVDARDTGAFFSAGKGDAGKELDMFILRFNGKLDPNFLAQWFTSSQVGDWNWQRWASKDFDKLLDDASSELDDTKRTDIMIKAQGLMNDSAAFVWLTYDVSMFAYRSWLKPWLLPSGIDWQLDRFSA